MAGIPGIRPLLIAVAVGGALAAPAGAADFFWLSGNYGAPANPLLPNPLSPGDRVLAQGAASKTFSGIAFENQGVFEWQTGVNIGFVSSTIANAGTWDLQADANLAYAGGNPSSFTNTGTFRKSAGAGVSSIGNAIGFTNQGGTIDVQQGTLSFDSGSAAFTGGTTFTGAGVARIASNASFSGPVQSGNLLLQAGAYTGTNAELSGTTAWTGGTFAGSWQLNANQALNASGAASKVFSGTFLNEGTLNWQAAAQVGFVSATVTNDGLFDLQTDANLAYAGGNPSTFVNNATFRKSGGAGTSIVGNAITFQNNGGTIEVQSGTLRFDGGSTTFGDGTVFTGAGTVRVASDATFNGTSTSANLELAAGQFTGANDARIDGTTSWTGGGFSGTWLLAADQSIQATGLADKNFSGVNFVNQGTLTWNTADRVGMVNATLSNEALFDIQADADVVYAGGNPSTLVNTGTFRKSGGAGATSIASSVTFTSNGGTIDAQTGVINFASGSASFNTGTQFVGAGINRVSANATFSGTSHSANLELNNGTYTGTHPVAGGRASLTGSVRWTRGQFAGRWLVGNGQVLIAENGGDKNFNTVDFLNQGTVTWRSTERIGFASATLTNESLFDIETDAALQYVGGNASTFVNAATGTFRKSGGAGNTTLGGSIAFVNQGGTIEAQSGNIVFAGGLSTAFEAGTRFIGAGAVRVSNGATFSGGFESTNLVLSGGTYTGTAAQPTGAVSWSGGSFGGTWTLPAGSTIEAVDGTDKNFNTVTFTNHGTLTWNSAQRAGFASATLNNNGVFDLRADANLTYIGGNPSTFTNAAGATLRKSGGAGTSTIGSNVGFVNDGGTVDVQTGTIAFAGVPTFNAGTRLIGAGTAAVTNGAAFNGAFEASNLVLQGGTYAGTGAEAAGALTWTGGTFGGTWQVAPGATLVASGAGARSFNTTTFTNRGTVSWETTQNIAIASAALVNEGLFDIKTDADLVFIGGNSSALTNDGVLRKSGGDATTSFAGSGTTFVNNGTIEALSGTILLPATFTNPGTIKGTATVQAATLTNTGTIAPGNSPGTLTFAGNLVMTDTSVLEIELEGASSFDVLAVTGSAALDGTLTVKRLAGYTPALGASFVVMTYGSRVGASEFDVVEALGWGSGVQFALAYGPNDVTLNVTAVPEPETYAMMLAGLGLLGLAARRRRLREQRARA